jgi:hypothetical protein
MLTNACKKDYLSDTTAGRVIMGKRAAIYVRVSTDEQSVENQEAELRRDGRAHGA